VGWELAEAGIGFLADRRRQGLEANWATIEIIDDRSE
jgi:hypothetical protein